MGTGNRILPLGEQYLELFAVVDATQAASNPVGRWFLARLASQDSFLAWALPTDDLDAVSRRLGIEPEPLRMDGADGETLSWRLAGNAEAFPEPGLPFFIQWDEPAANASMLAPNVPPLHDVDATGISWIEVQGDERRLRERIGPDGAPVRITPGPPAIEAVGIATRGDEIVFLG